MAKSKSLSFLHLSEHLFTSDTFPSLALKAITVVRVELNFRRECLGSLEDRIGCVPTVICAQHKLCKITGDLPDTECPFPLF